MFDFLVKISKQKDMEFKDNSKKKIDLLYDINYKVENICGDHFNLFTYSHQDEANVFRTNEVVVAIMGEVYSNQEYSQLTNSEPRQLSSEEIFELYSAHGQQCIKYLKGIFIILFFDTILNKYFIFRSKSGLLMAYYYADKDFLLISSCLDSIKSYPGINTELDSISIVEHSLFDFPLGNRTHYKFIKIVDNMSCLVYDLREVTQVQFYDYAKQICAKPIYNWNDTYREVPDLFNKTVDLLSANKPRLNAGLTSGFDSRTVLSRLYIQKESVQFFTYGLPTGIDVRIAKKIVNKFGLRYKHIDFSDPLFSQEYQNNWDKLLFFSDGFGNLKRTNQIYAQRRLSEFSRNMITGYFGSEILRPISATDTLLRPNLIKLLLSKEFLPTLESIYIAEYSKKFLFDQYLDVNKQDVMQDIAVTLAKTMMFPEVYRRTLHFMLSSALWKFFGQEFHSSRMYSMINAPYIDDDFIDFVLQTPVPELDNIAFKKQYKALQMGQLFYLPILEKNFKALTEIPTGRYYTPKSLKSRIFPMNVIIPYSRYRIEAKYRLMPTFDTNKWNSKTVYNSKYYNEMIFASDCLNRVRTSEFYKEVSLLQYLSQ
jgi:hypothetical protein